MLVSGSLKEIILCQSFLKQRARKSQFITKIYTNCIQAQPVKEFDRRQADEEMVEHWEHLSPPLGNHLPHRLRKRPSDQCILLLAFDYDLANSSLVEYRAWQTSLHHRPR